jgi:hypothetical protein
LATVQFVAAVVAGAADVLDPPDLAVVVVRGRVVEVLEPESDFDDEPQAPIATVRARSPPRIATVGLIERAISSPP